MRCKRFQYFMVRTKNYGGCVVATRRVVLDTWDYRFNPIVNLDGSSRSGEKSELQSRRF